MEWALANAGWLLPTTALVLINLINGLLRHKDTLDPRLGDLLRGLVDALSVLVNKNSPGTLKPPLTRSNHPKAPPTPREPPLVPRKKSGATTIFTLLVLLASSGGCAGVKDTVLRAQSAGVRLHKALRDTCRPVVEACIAANDPVCKPLVACQANRDKALKALRDVQVALADALEVE